MTDVRMMKNGYITTLGDFMPAAHHPLRALIVKSLTFSDTSFTVSKAGRIVLPRAQVEDCLIDLLRLGGAASSIPALKSNAAMRISIDLSVIDAYMNEWLITLKTWQNVVSGQHRPTFVLENTASFMQTYNIQQGDVLVICVNGGRLQLRTDMPGAVVNPSKGTGVSKAVFLHNNNNNIIINNNDSIRSTFEVLDGDHSPPPLHFGGTVPIHVIGSRKRRTATNDVPHITPIHDINHHAHELITKRIKRDIHTHTETLSGEHAVGEPIKKTSTKNQVLSSADVDAATALMAMTSGSKSQDTRTPDHQSDDAVGGAGGGHHKINVVDGGAGGGVSSDEASVDAPTQTEVLGAIPIGTTASTKDLAQDLAHYTHPTLLLPQYRHALTSLPTHLNPSQSLINNNNQQPLPAPLQQPHPHEETLDSTVLASLICEYLKTAASATNQINLQNLQQLHSVSGRFQHQLPSLPFIQPYASNDTNNNVHGVGGNSVGAMSAILTTMLQDAAALRRQSAERAARLAQFRAIASSNQNRGVVALLQTLLHAPWSNNNSV